MICAINGTDYGHCKNLKNSDSQSTESSLENDANKQQEKPTILPYLLRNCPRRTNLSKGQKKTNTVKRQNNIVLG